MKSNAIADSVIRIPCQSLQGFFESWFQILKPIHKLSNSEIKLIATIVRLRYDLSKKITDKDLLNDYIMGKEFKRTILKESGMKLSSFRVSMCKLQKQKVFVNGQINPKLIPNIGDNNDYKLLLYFDLNEKQGSTEDKR